MPHQTEDLLLPALGVWRIIKQLLNPVGFPDEVG